LERDFCGKRGALKSGGAAATLLAALLIAIFFPVAASAQALRKDSKPAISASETQQAVAGKDLFNQHCASCHFTETTAQKIGPGLKDLYRRLTFSDGKRITDASLAKWIEVGGKNMPGFKDDITPGQIRELISYIKTR
jgi:mono/diheme cytochrome c family protein